MTGETDSTLAGIQKLLIALQKDEGKPCKVGGLVEQLQSPYRGNIIGVLANLSLIKYESKGIYTIEDFQPSQSLAMAVRTACIQATSKGKGKKLIPLAEYEGKPKPEVTREIIREPMNPFGFAAFDFIVVDKGIMIVGGYKLEGSFTLTKLP
jgi:hypothetical protein